MFIMLTHDAVLHWLTVGWLFVGILCRLFD